MKKSLLLSLLLSLFVVFGSMAQSRTVSGGTFFNNDELEIVWQGKVDAWMPGEREYEKAWIYFTNKTNNKIRVKYQCTAYLIRYDVSFSYSNTIIINPNSTGIDEVISHHKNLFQQHESICNIEDFKFINYAVEPVNYKTDW